MWMVVAATFQAIADGNPLAWFACLIKKRHFPRSPTADRSWCFDQLSRSLDLALNQRHFSNRIQYRRAGSQQLNRLTRE